MTRSLTATARIISRLARGLLIRVVIRVGGGVCGPWLQAERGTTFLWGGHSGLCIGSRVKFGRGVVIDVPRGAHLSIGDDVKVMHYTVIAAAHHIAIGNLVQVAEHCSIRDSDHGMALGVSMQDQTVSSPTRIGADAWIGRGTAILRGSVVGEGAVLGANSVLKGELSAYTVAVGAPARVIKRRS